MEWLGPVWKLLDNSARWCAAITFAAVAVALLRWFTLLPISDDWFVAVVCAGLVCGSLLAIDGARRFWSFLVEARRALRRRTEGMEIAVRNLDSLSPDHMRAFLYIRSKTKQRFLEDASNPILLSMVDHGLLEIERPARSNGSGKVFFRVPDKIWERRRELPYPERVPKSEPWVQSDRI